MRITIVVGFFLPVPPVAGGASEKSWFGLAKEFARAGHAVTLISRRWPGFPDRETQDGVQHLRLPGFSHTERLWKNLWLDLLWSWRVWRQLPPADITIVNCIALPVWLGWFRRGAGRVAVMPGRVPKGQYRVYRRVDRVLAVSSPIAAAVLLENPQLQPVTRIFGYPIDWTSFAGGGKPARSAPLTIGFVGRLHREKGLDLLAAAAAQLAARSDLPPWRLLLCGPADVARGGSGESYRAELERKFAAALPGDRVTFLDPIFDPTQLIEVYRRLDVFCYPSLAAEGETFGVAVAEAMAAGAVPVVSALPCFTDFVRMDVTGGIFDHTAEDASQRLADALARLLGDDAARARMAEAAREEVRRYDFPNFAARLLADFSTLK